MGNAWGFHQASMGLDGDWSLGIPWNGSMGNAVGFHGLALGAAHWEFHSKCSMGMPLGCPDGAPMELHWYCSIGAPWKCLMGNTWAIPHVASMGLAGDWSLGIPWDGSMGNAMGFHGLPLGLLTGHSMGMLYG